MFHVLQVYVPLFWQQEQYLITIYLLGKAHRLVHLTMIIFRITLNNVTLSFLNCPNYTQ